MLSASLNITFLSLSINLSVADIIGNMQKAGKTGIVAVRDASGLKPICDVSWDDNEAAVVCRELGYKSGKSQCCSRLSWFTRNLNASPRVAYSGFECRGTESRLVDCKHTVVTTCPQRHLASVICYTQVAKLVPMGKERYIW